VTASQLEEQKKLDKQRRKMANRTVDELLAMIEGSGSGSAKSAGLSFSFFLSFLS